MMTWIYLATSLIGWLACARLNYRYMTRRGWFDEIKTKQQGVRYGSDCPDFYKTFHPVRGGCAKCEPRPKDVFVDGTTPRILLALAGPLLLTALFGTAAITGRQPLSPIGQEQALKKAEADLAEANDKLAALEDGEE
jgi:hypothetical protein